MGRVTLTLPRLGETMEEAKVVVWLVAPGAAFARGEVLVEVETDKSVVEVPALTAGTLIAQLVAPGQTVTLDQPIAEVEVEGADAALNQPIPPDAQHFSPPPQGEGPGVRGADAPMIQAEATRASPAARAAARHAGVDLMTLTGTGRRGRIQAHDVAGAQRAEVTLVLLHGLFDDSSGWRDLPLRLRAVGHVVVTPDLPGHGNSPAASDFDAALTQLAAALPAGPLRLIGHSLGAAMAVRLAVGLGERVTGMVLTAPVGLGRRINPDFTDGMRHAQTPAALALALSLLDIGPVSDRLLAEELSRVQALRAGHAVLADAIARGGFQQIDITGDLARLGCPVTVLFGTGDRILDWQDIASLPPAAAIHLVRGAGHLPHLAAPELFFDLIGDPAQRRIVQA